MQTLIIPSNAIRDMDGLALLISGLERVTGGGKINVRQAVIIETECKPVIWMLQDLLLGDRKRLPEPDPLAEIEAPKADSEPTPKGLNTRNSKPGKLRKYKSGKPGKPIHLAGSRPIHVQGKEVKAWRITACALPLLVGEVYTGQAVRQGLRLEKFPPGTLFHHPKHGNMVVDAAHKLVRQEVPA